MTSSQKSRVVGARNACVDLISGVLVLWMIIYHAFQWAGLDKSFFYDVLLGLLYWFMAWFYFKSGWMSASSHREGKVDYIRKLARKLIGPMLMWCLVGFFVATVISLVFGQEVFSWKSMLSPIYLLVRFGFTQGNSPLWFLMSLFFVQAIFCYLECRICFMLIPVGAIIVGYTLSYFDILLPLGFSTVPLGMLFFSCGKILSKFNDKVKPQRNSILLILICLFLFVFFRPSYVDIRINQLVHGDYFSFAMSSLLAVLSAVLLLKNVRCSFMETIGKDSMFLFVAHWPIFTIAKAAHAKIFGHNYLVDSGYGLFFFLIASVIVSYCVWRKIRSVRVDSLASKTVEG